jgi:hypothetical protein
MKIWIVTWDTESGDRGICGAWKTKPNQWEALTFMKKTFPEEFTDDGNFISWNVEEMTVYDTISDGSDIVTN